MGKVVSFVLALSDLGLFALLVFAPGRDLPRDAGLVFGFLTLAVIAWVVAFTTALYRSVILGASFKPTLTLLAFFWLPALPALFYGLSGASALFRRESRRPAPQPVPAVVVPTPRARFALPPVDKRLTTARHRRAAA